MTSMTVRQMKDANVRQIIALKAALKVESQNHNARLRLMFGVCDVETIQENRCVNLLHTNFKMKPHHCCDTSTLIECPSN